MSRRRNIAFFGGIMVLSLVLSILAALPNREIEKVTVNIPANEDPKIFTQTVFLCSDHALWTSTGNKLADFHGESNQIFSWAEIDTCARYNYCKSPNQRWEGAKIVKEDGEWRAIYEIENVPVRYTTIYVLPVMQNLDGEFIAPSPGYYQSFKSYYFKGRYDKLSPEIRMEDARQIVYNKYRKEE